MLNEWWRYRLGKWEVVVRRDGRGKAKTDHRHLRKEPLFAIRIVSGASQVPPPPSVLTGWTCSTSFQAERQCFRTGKRLGDYWWSRLCVQARSHWDLGSHFPGERHKERCPSKNSILSTGVECGEERNKHLVTDWLLKLAKSKEERLTRAHLLVVMSREVPKSEKKS